LITESSKDPSSEQTQKLQKIALASQHGLNYFASVVNDTYYPTLFNWSILEATRASNKLAFCAVVLTGAGYLSKELLQYTVPCYATIPVKVSLVACIGFNAIRYLNLCYRYNSSIVKTQSMKFFFEKAIASENVKFPMTSSEFSTSLSTYEYVVEPRENVTEKSSKST